ncbi:endonuclease/exonuclease/phosphatase family protein [Jiella mangrovi]|uniref:Endonuclease/exonuclease/phosphatase family protein n=1 Tax=Jiella mangrovi TaxID=2821407 RepID=A0ABS4BI48_9HYPH|nr:endonuclease/exonuclease/phosphatase family protein [Jiella mangrovi]MBP0616420.1 endonuclease/exonuclease/phosphatase family protein [Jiella mangrovi]
MKTSLHRLFATLALGLALLLGAALVCGFFGQTVPFFDSLGQFRAHLTVALFAVALLLLSLRRVLAAILAAAVAAYAVLSVSAFIVPRPAEPPSDPAVATAASGPRGPLTLLQMNLRYDADPAPAIAMITRLDPDIVTLQEINRRWADALGPLRSKYAHDASCGVGDFKGGLAILSKIPFGEDDAICRAEDGFLSRRLDLGQGTGLTVVSEHLVWPWPYRQKRQIARLTTVLPDLKKPLLVAGDFNAAPWSATVQRYADLSATTPAPGIGPTWLTTRLPGALRPFLGLPIDNILSSEGVRLHGVTRQAATASDHLPLLVKFDVPQGPTGAKDPARLVDQAPRR